MIDRERAYALGQWVEDAQMERGGAISVSADEVADRILAIADPVPTPITDEQVERAAVALAKRGVGAIDTWDEADIARVVLDAALNGDKR